MAIPKELSLRVGAGVAIGFLAAQFLRPELPRPPRTAELQAPAAVKQIFRTSCYPCHSNEVRLAWFDEIVPAYQLVSHDIKTGRGHLNFSEIEALPMTRRNSVLFEAVNHIQMGAMPLPRYTSLHPEAAITPTQLAVLKSYLLSLMPTAEAAQSTTEAADSQYFQWIGMAGKPMVIKDAPNGIAFMPDYKNWKVISSTERTDTKTLRLILGNEIAIKAVAGRHINPWPDGTVFAKVGFRQKAGADGAIETGEFFQVAFMIKDQAKYASTAGWGWAQWVGTELTPYGRGPEFTNECVSCHAPLRANDYVFTMPLKSVEAN